MAKEKICGVYCIENLVNGKKYIGSSLNIYKRFEDHKSALNNLRHENYLLQNAWNKYGKENFIFYIIEVEINNNRNEAFQVEQKYMDLFKTYNKEFGYNISDNSICYVSKPTTYEDIKNGKRKISQKQFNAIIYFLCNTNISIPKIAAKTNVSQRTIYQIYFKEQYCEVTRGYTFIQRKNKGETSSNSILTEKMVIEIIEKLLNKEYMVDIAREYNINQSTIWDIYNHNTWAHLTSDIKFPEYKKASGRTRKPILQYDLNGNFIAKYESAREAEKITGIGYKMISRVCNELRPYTHGFVFMFDGDDDILINMKFK